MGEKNTNIKSNDSSSSEYIDQETEEAIKVLDKVEDEDIPIVLQKIIDETSLSDEVDIEINGNIGGKVKGKKKRKRGNFEEPVVVERVGDKIMNNSRRILFCVFAGVLMSLNIRTFVHTGGLLPGGFAGVTLFLQSVVAKFLGFKIPYAPVYLALNLFPIILSFKKIGKKFTIYSCITIGLVAFLSDLFPAYIITSDILLISIFGGILNGFAVSVCLAAGATSGGTDFISIYLAEKYKIDAWNYILAFNALILVCDGFLFGWDKALYSIIFQYVSTQVINAAHKRYKKNTLFIVTNKPVKIAEMINRLTRHGATQIEAVGMYDDAKRSIIYSVIDSAELKCVMREIHEVDPKAFVNVLRTDHLIGRFYMRPND